MAFLGGLTLAVGLFRAPERTWINLLLVSYYLVGLGLGGLLLVALHYLTGARWILPLRRVPEAMTAVLPLAAAGLVAVLLGRPSLYPWSVPDSPHGSDSPLKHIWLNRPFFVMRALVYLALWLAFAVAVVRTSRRQDRDHDPAPTRKNIRLSAAFLVVFGVTCWLASYDWIMSLEPEWASTVFGVYNFAGLFLSGLAAVVLLVIWLWRQNPLQAVLNENHLHDLGTLLFAMSSFWMYTWFCQYLLIWYVNNPEETAYLRRRWQGSWPVWLFLDLALNWAIPFLVLLSRSAKRNPRVLGTVAALVLAGRWVDLFLMIFPSQVAEASMPGALDVGLLLGAAGLFGLAFFRGLSKASLVPIHEPIRIEERHPPAPTTE
jgi:Ni/Fe-hydrogenase subunit HybB-like protein